MKNQLAKIYIQELIKEIGPGFHLDTPMSDYFPEFKNADELQKKLDFVHEHGVGDIYEYAFDMYCKQFNVEVI